MMFALFGPIWGMMVIAGGWLVRNQIGQWILSALLFLGIELTTREVVLGPLLTELTSRLSGLPGDVASTLGFLNVDRYISIVVSAYSAAALRSVIVRRKA